jgi:hypothetical protein
MPGTLTTMSTAPGITPARSAAHLEHRPQRHQRRPAGLPQLVLRHRLDARPTLHLHAPPHPWGQKDTTP